MTSFIRPPLHPDVNTDRQPDFDMNVPRDPDGQPHIFPAAPPTPATLGIDMGVGHPFVTLGGASIAEEFPWVSGRRAHPDISEPGCG